MLITKPGLKYHLRSLRLIQIRYSLKHEVMDAKNAKAVFRLPYLKNVTAISV